MKSLLIMLVVLMGCVLAHAQELPPDLPLAASPASSEAWLRTATILQPYAHSQYVALLNPGDRPVRLRKDFGFNAIVVLPTDAHNSQTAAAEHLTDAQFRNGIEAYRKAGFKIILYTSVMALGLSQEFQSGQIAHDHPDWDQRDPKGNPIMVYGVPWLCPSTGARQAALDRAVRLVQDYKPDGILLDNNQFYFTAAGWTCHCEACTAGFRQYAQNRFGHDATEKLFGAKPAELLIPSQEGPLFSLWMQWRNRVWADVVESFRARLREIDPHIILFANTQYLFKDGVLATDDQYAREDVVISESVGLNSRQMSDKMVLGHAIAQGRPLWNYIGTFTNGEDYTGIKPASAIGPLIAATIAHGARPWIVDGFDLGATDPAARAEMSRLLSWHAAHEEFYRGEPWAGVATLISLRSRDVLHRPVIPPSVSALREAGTLALRDDAISAKSLATFHIVTAETSACLSPAAADVLAEWVRDGGTLIAAADAGAFDELGRKRDVSTLWHALHLSAAPKDAVAIGKGKVIAPANDAFAKTVLKYAEPYSFGLPSDSGVEIVPYISHDLLLMHVVRHGPANGPVTLQLPEEFNVAGKAAMMYTPGAEKGTKLPLSTVDGRASLLLKASLPEYCVIAVLLRFP